MSNKTANTNKTTAAANARKGSDKPASPRKGKGKTDAAPVAPEPETVTLPEPAPIVETLPAPETDETLPEATDAELAAIMAKGDAVANAENVTDMDSPAAKPAKDWKRKSDVDGPVAKVWTWGAELIALHPDWSNKQIIAALVGMGIAYYTARTQLQAYKAAAKKSAAAAAQVQAAQ